MGKHGARKISKCIRFPRTTQERRWNTAHFEHVRGRRHPNNLPTAWDDKNVDGLYHRSWKSKFKKHRQWEKKSLKFNRQIISWKHRTWYRGFIIREYMIDGGKSSIEVTKENSKIPIMIFEMDDCRYWKRFMSPELIVDKMIDEIF